MLVTHSGHSCWPLMLVTHAGQSCWPLMMVTHAGQSFWSLMLATHAGHSCWSLILVTHSGHSCWPLMLVTHAGHYWLCSLCLSSLVSLAVFPVWHNWSHFVTHMAHPVTLCHTWSHFVTLLDPRHPHPPPLTCCSTLRLLSLGVRSWGMLRRRVLSSVMRRRLTGITTISA